MCNGEVGGGVRVRVRVVVNGAAAVYVCVFDVNASVNALAQSVSPMTGRTTQAAKRPDSPREPRCGIQRLSF